MTGTLFSNGLLLEFLCEAQTNRVLTGLGGLGVLFILFIFIFISLRATERSRRLKQKELDRQRAEMQEAAFRAAEDRGLTADVAVEDYARRQMISNIIQIAQENPEDTAQAVRGWVRRENE